MCTKAIPQHSPDTIVLKRLPIGHKKTVISLDQTINTLVFGKEQQLTSLKGLNIFAVRSCFVHDETCIVACPPTPSELCPFCRKPHLDEDMSKIVQKKKRMSHERQDFSISDQYVND